MSDEDWECPVCMESFKFAVTASCGHSFCGPCLTEYWQKDKEKQINCPLCRTPISMIIPNTVVRKALELLRKDSVDEGTLKRNAKYDSEIDDYNSKFSNASRSVGATLNEDIFLLRHLAKENPTFKYFFFFVVLLALIYLIFPTDIIPDNSGITGYLDDAFVWVVLVCGLLFVAAWYRSKLIREHQARTALLKYEK